MHLASIFRGITGVALSLAIVATVQAQYSGGSGTADDPYQIATATDLIALGETADDYDKHFILTADIDLDPNLPGGRVFDRAVIAPHHVGNTRPTWYTGTPFSGVFDGDNHTISNLTITAAGPFGCYLGLFGGLDYGAEIRNLKVMDVRVAGEDACGGLVGISRGVIRGCYTSGHVSGGYCVGGLVGEIPMDDWWGLLEVYPPEIIVSCCHSSAIVTGTGDVGGLVGQNLGGNVTQCWSAGAINGGDSIYGGFGGLVGSNGGSITTSYSTGAVAGEENVGGLAGRNNGSITTSYSTGAVTGVENVGGLVGSNDGNITTSYSTGAVEANGNVVGGLVGYNDEGNVATSFWDVGSSGLSGSDGGVGLTTAEMMDPEVLGLNGLANEPNWVLAAHDDYPRLIWEETEGQTVPEPVIDWLAGDGSEEYPYELSTVDQLVRVSKASVLADKHFRLTNDLDLSGLTWSQAVLPHFGGRLNGSGRSIHHLHVQGTRHLGLFGRIGEGAVVTNVNLQAVDVNGVADVVGGLVGRNEGDVRNCSSAGTVAGDQGVGGLVGRNEGDVGNCSSTGTVAGDQDVGGLAGSNSTHRWSNSGGTITASCSAGSVIGRETVGGLVGDNRETITASYSTGTVSGGNCVGGLAGCNYGGIDTSYSTGTVTGDEGIGGLVGKNGRAPLYWYSHLENVSILSCYSAGNVVGGANVGGLVGVNHATIVDSFWDVQASEQSCMCGYQGASGPSGCDDSCGKTTAQMQTLATFVAKSGWYTCGETSAWTIDEENDYPRLWWEHAPGQPVEAICASAVLPGSGTRDDPYLIYTAEGLRAISAMICDLDKHFMLMADIDFLAGIGTTPAPIGIPGQPFSGVFDGNGHTISGIHYESDRTEERIGLFGYVGGPDAEIRNVGLVNPRVIAPAGSWVGGLVGSLANGTVRNCFVQGGTVSGSWCVGALVGWSGGTVANCWSSCAVSGESWVGGLLGSTNGSITYCYSSGMVSGTWSVGGLLGVSGNTLDIRASFWNIETSGQDTSAGGTGLTTAEMLTASTFLDSGWDFIDETENGTDDIWWILEGQDYPRLWWELQN